MGGVVRCKLGAVRCIGVVEGSGTGARRGEVELLGGGRVVPIDLLVVVVSSGRRQLI